jgi:hypothetical protein
MNDRIEWQIHEAEARRLRAQYAGDWLVRAFVALDVAIRRAARAILSPERSRAARTSSPAGRRTPCRS